MHTTLSFTLLVALSTAIISNAAASQQSYIQAYYREQFEGLAHNASFKKCMEQLDDRLRKTTSAHKYYNSLLFTPKLLAVYDGLGLEYGATPLGFNAAFSFVMNNREEWSAYTVAFSKPKRAFVQPVIVSDVESGKKKKTMSAPKSGHFFEIEEEEEEPAPKKSNKPKGKKFGITTKGADSATKKKGFTIVGKAAKPEAPVINNTTSNSNTTSSISNTTSSANNTTTEPKDVVNPVVAEVEEENLDDAAITFMIYRLQGEDIVRIVVMDDKSKLVDFNCAIE